MYLHLNQKVNLQQKLLNKLFDMTKSNILNLVSTDGVKVVTDLYGDFDAWLNTKIEQLVNQTK